MEDLTELEWQILDSLAHGLSSTATMEIPEVELKKIRNIVYDLYQRGLLYEFNGKVDYTRLMNEPSEQVDPDNEYTFGLTELGSTCWEQGSRVYSENPIDWSNACILIIDVKTRWGYVEGVTKEVCMSKVEEIPEWSQWEIEQGSISHLKIEGFNPVSHKYIPGGHRISFKIKKKSNP